MPAPDGGEGVAMLLEKYARDAGVCQNGLAPRRLEQE